MKTLTSKRSILQTAVLLGFGVILFGFFGVVLTAQFLKNPATKTLMLLFIGVGAFAFSAYSFYYYLKNFPSIEITNSEIIVKTPFKRLKINFNEIESIGLMRKSPLSFMWITMPIESSSILTKDNDEIILWDDYYRNIAQIKVRLEQISKGLKTGNLNFENEITPDQTPLDLRLEHFDEIKGNGLFNMNALMFWGILAFWLIMVGPKMTTASVNGIIFSILFIGFFYGLLGYQLNYYLLSDNYFQIRNHLWFWKRKTFRLTDLKEIVFEEPHKLSKSVRVRTVDFKTTLHPGGSLRDKHWIELREKLKKRGIEVRDELLHW